MKKRKVLAVILSLCLMLTTMMSSATDMMATELECPHMWEVVIPLHDCEMGGFVEYLCLMCTEWKTEFVDPGSHNWDSGVVTAPTCTEQGYTTHSCANCESTYVDTYIEATGHTLDPSGRCMFCTYYECQHDWQVMIPLQDCEMGGLVEYFCLLCMEHKTEFVNPTVHNWDSEEVTAPTCTEQGYTTHSCANCESTYVDNYTEATGHTYENGVCSVCGEVEEGPGWVLADDGTLTIYTNAGMTDWTNNGRSTYKSSVMSVVIESGVTSIEKQAFDHCTSLAMIDLGSVETIGEGAFSYCESLTSITIPDSVTSIEKQAFDHCTSLAMIDLGSVEAIGEGAFSYCESLTSITIPDSVTSIEKQAFDHCTSLAMIDLGSVEAIGKSAFEYCKSLTSITIPDSVTSIGEGAFSHCESLTSITIPNKVKTIESYAFAYCYELETVELGSSVETINDFAFIYCTSLRSITIPISVTSIGRNAFYLGYSASNAIVDVYYEGTSTQWGNISISSGNTNLTSAFIHYNSSSAHTHTHSTDFAWNSDNSACTVTIGCSGCSSIKVIDCTVTSEVGTTVSCTVDGTTIYTATASLASEEYTDSQTVVTAAATGYHTYENGSCTVCGEAEPNSYGTVTVGSVALSNGEYTTNGSTKTSGTPSGTGYAYFSEGVLYLNGFSISGTDNGIVSDDDLNIQATGDSKLVVNNVGIRSISGGVTITGGSITINAGKESAVYSSYGDIVISDCTIVATSDNYGVIYSTSGNLSISNSNVTATSNSSCIAIGTEGLDSVISIADSTVVTTSVGETAIGTNGSIAISGDVDITANGIVDAGGAITIKGSGTIDVITPEPPSGAPELAALSAYQNVTIEGVTLNITGYCQSVKSVTGDVTISNAVITADECIYAEGSIKITDGSNIMVISSGSGIYAMDSVTISDSAVSASASSDSMAIIAKTGNINLSDSNITASAVSGCALYTSTGNVVITNCTVKATSDNHGVIASGSGNVTISGSDVTATSKSSSVVIAAESLTSVISIADSTVTAATTGEFALGSNGSVEITGQVDITTDGGISVNSGNITIQGSGTAKIVAHGPDYSTEPYAPKIAALDAYYDIIIEGVTLELSGSDYSIVTNGGNITMTDATVTADGQIYAENDITVTNSTITAETDSTATIKANSGSIRLTGSEVTASSVSTYALYSRSGDIVISDSTVDATSVDYGVIGVDSGDLTISDGSNVTATAKSDRVAIGTGGISSNLSITDSTVVATATGDEYSIFTNGILTISGDVDVTGYGRIGANNSASAIPATGGTLEISIGSSASDITSTTVATEEYTIAQTGYSYIRIKATTAHTHTTEIQNAKDATCTEDGYTGDEVCAVCGETITSGEVIPATGHSYEAVVTDPTCTEQGYTTYTCSVCGDSYVDNYTAALGHSTEIQNAKDATCTEDGYTGDEICTVCGETITSGEVIPATGHSYEAVVTDPTCTEQGYTTYTCSVCGDSYVDNYTAALGHSYGEPVWTWDANGGATATFTCTNDSSHVEVLTATVNAVGNLGVVTKTATVTFNGVTYTSDPITTGTSLLVVKADYTLVNLAIARANGLNASSYSNFSDVTAAINAVRWNLNVLNQSTVNSYAAAINSAIDNLVAVSQEVVEETIEVVDPVEDTDTDTEPDEMEVSEPETEAETNPTTGLAISLIPIAIALVATGLSKKKQ